MNINEKIISMEMKARLSTLWIFVLLNMIFRDIHELFRPGMLEEMMTLLNSGQITEGLLLLGGIMIEIPIAMVPLSQILKSNVNRWTNMIVAIVTMALVFLNNTTPDLDDIFFAAIETISLALIIWYAWQWRQEV